MNDMHPQHPDRSGQIALIALLAVVVMMTVGVSLYSRSTLDVSLSRQQDLAAQVYQAAESGVEAALGEDFSTITAPKTVQSGDVTYTISPQSQLVTRVEEGESLQIKTDPATTVARTLALTWGKGLACPSVGASPSDTTPPPLLVRVYNSSSGIVTARNYGISPCSYGTQDFARPATGLTSGANGFTYSLPLQVNDARVSIQPMYASAEITISGGTWLPTQFYRITSVASASATSTTRESAALEVTRTLPQWPAFMDYVLYSGGTIVK